MNFGDGYKVIRDNLLELGVYKARIVRVNCGFWKSGDKKVDVTVEIQGKQHAKPNTFVINDKPRQAIGKMTYEQTVENWCKNVTQFFDAFGIEAGNFNWQSWQGHTGTVTCRMQRNGKYRELVAGTHSTQPQTSSRGNQNTQQNSASVDGWANSYAENDYPPDINF